MKKLDTVVEDYVRLNDFLNNTLTKIGKVDDNNLVIFNYITNIGEVETGLNSLSKFPEINSFYYQGRFVDKSNYALKGLKLTVTVDPKWDKSTKVVEKEPSFEEKLEQSTDSVDQDKDKNRTEIPPKEDKPERNNQRNTNQQNNSNATTTTRR